MEEAKEELTLDEKRQALSSLVVAEVTLAHQYNIVRDAILAKDGYHGVSASFAIEWLEKEISRIDGENRKLNKEIEDEDAKNS